MVLINDASTAGPSGSQLPSSLSPPADSMVARRSRRSNAGNRMQEAMAEMAAELAADALEQEDVDFEFQEEEDVFGSDFEETDDDEMEETEQAAAEAEREVRAEERSRRKVRVYGIPSNRKTLEQQTELAHKRQMATFDPAASSASVKAPTAPSPVKATKTKAVRQSHRKSAVKNRGDTARKMKQQEQKRTCSSEALENQEENIRSHRDYLQIEDEKRRKATNIRRETVEGPLIRWISRVEERQPDSPLTEQPSSPLHYQVPLPTSARRTTKTTRNYLVHELDQPSSSLDSDDDEEDSVPLPSWSQTMSAVFGSHVDWDKLQVWPPGSDRPLTRPIAMCPITGEPAKYLDPRTNVPFRDPSVYKILTDVAKGDYAWAENAGIYVGRANELGMKI
ncbi:hypothetical protein DL96DRAFT_1588716 [Flagelloscypha sp. PMI_526]|nr:hypothetical protein DL96DRAFT_1588716 [Flagelloscypha sp. PMI_526]